MATKPDNRRKRQTTRPRSPFLESALLTRVNLSALYLYLLFVSFVSSCSFDRYLSRASRPSKVPWGRSLSYGGFGPIQLPKEFRSKQEPPTRVQKGHRHYGGGVMPLPR